MPAKDLPARPSLQHLRNQARDLVNACKKGDAEALARAQAHRPGFEAATPPHATIHDAQWIVAREYGFASWAKLKAHVERVSGAAPVHRPFARKIGYYAERAEGLLSACAAGEQHALQKVRRAVPRFEKLGDEDVRKAFTLDDAKALFAKDHGFKGWDAFAAHIEALGKGAAREPFLEAFEAIEQGGEAAVRALVDKHPELVRAAGTNGNSLLNLAISCHKPAIAKLLLDAGAETDLANNHGWTPLHQAAYSNMDGVAGWLLDAGADVEAQAHGDGGTPLVQALFWGHHALAARLAERGVWPNNLRVAAGLGRLDLVRACFEADGALKPHAGEHRQFHRPHSGFPPWTPANARQEILDEALVWAARNDQAGVMTLLVERGADVNADPYRGTPLAWAARGGKLNAIRWLLDHGAEIDRKGTFGGPGHGEGVPALNLAAQAGQLDAVKLLVERGADINLVDDVHGGSAIGWAEQGGHPEIAAFLSPDPAH